MDVMKFLGKCGRILIVVAIVVVLILIITFLVLNFYPPIGSTPDKKAQTIYAGKTNLYYDRQFHNENDFSVMTGEEDGRNSMTVPDRIIPAEKIEGIEQAADGELRITWLGHSTSLIQLGNSNIFIDPVLSDRSSPVGFAGPERFSEVALKTEDVPDIDVVFISHDHYDHLDYNVIKEIDGRVSHYVVPLGIDVILKGWGVDESKLHPLYWWESVELNGNTYTLIPAQHYTGRNPMKMNATLWGGIYIKNNAHSIYYSGDTGYYDVFEQIFDRFGETELMLADAGQYDDGWAMTHMFPEETVKAAKDVHAEWLIPVHWGAFSLSNHAWYDPPERAVKAAVEQGVNLATPRLGQTVSYDEISSFNEHWWEEYMSDTGEIANMTIK